MQNKGDEGKKKKTLGNEATMGETSHVAGG